MKKGRLILVDNPQTILNPINIGKYAKNQFELSLLNNVNPLVAKTLKIAITIIEKKICRVNPKRLCPPMVIIIADNRTYRTQLIGFTNLSCAS